MRIARRTAFVCLLVLVFSLGSANAALICRADVACDLDSMTAEGATDPAAHPVVRSTSHCRKVAATISACCIDRGNGEETRLIPGAVRTTGLDLADAGALLYVRVGAPDRSLIERSSAAAIATPSLPLYRVHAALLI